MTTENHSPAPAGKFRKRPVVIDAWKIVHDDAPRPEWVQAALIDETIDFDPSGEGMYINTLEGGCMHASMGDMLIRGVKGELYACAADIFEATYEAAATPAPAPAVPETAQRISDMIASFEAEYTACWDDPAMRAERDVWARAWRSATASPVAGEKVCARCGGIVCDPVIPQDASSGMTDAIQAAVLAERERWVSICKEHAADTDPPHKPSEDNYGDGWLDACNEIMWSATGQDTQVTGVDHG